MKYEYIISGTRHEIGHATGHVEASTLLYKAGFFRTHAFRLFPDPAPDDAEPLDEVNLNERTRFLAVPKGAEPGDMRYFYGEH